MSKRSSTQKRTRLFAFSAITWLGLLILAIPNAYGSQIAVSDLAASEKVAPEFARALTPTLLAALAKIPNLVILSQHDIQAFLEKDASLQPADCKPERCFFEVSDNLESEFILRGTLGRLGRKWIASLSLTHLDQDTVVRHSTGARTGNDSAAKDALLNAVRNLFRDELPAHLQGPRSLSRLGFQATVYGLAKRVRTPNLSLQEHRKRLILDLVATELEYDVAPKIDILDTISRNEIANLKLESFMAPSREVFMHYLNAQQIWRTLREDLNRVREIRARARTLGIQPTARPLRFEAPSAIEWPAQSQVDAYIAAAAPAAPVIQQLLQGWQTGDEKLMASVYSSAHRSALNYRVGLRSNKTAATPKHFHPIAFHNLSPRMLEAAIEAHSRGELLIYLAELNGERVEAASRVFLIQDDGAWKIRHW